ncbi:MAG: PGPGW domain-containing protein [Candidatus Magnetoovum sp. WYHC-5]|nr:PGPGW domain-containing protein [Candidatus Magnetoovum sp. WYHC-5]
MFKNVAKTSWRVVKITTGGLVLVVGVLMIVLPGPAIIVIPAGLAILASEFKWANGILKWFKDKVKSKFQKSNIKEETNAK